MSYFSDFTRHVCNDVVLRWNLITHGLYYMYIVEDKRKPGLLADLSEGLLPISIRRTAAHCLGWYLTYKCMKIVINYYSHTSGCVQVQALVQFLAG